MNVETTVEVEVEERQRDGIAAAAAVAALTGKAVRIGPISAHPNGRADAWVRDCRLAAGARRTPRRFAQLAREFGVGKR